MNTMMVKVLNETIAMCEKRVSEIKDILDADPITTVIAGRQQAQAIMEKHKGDYATIARLIDPLAKAEKKAFAAFEKQKKSCELIDEQVKLEFEAQQCRNELWIRSKRQ